MRIRDLFDRLVNPPEMKLVKSSRFSESSSEYLPGLVAVLVGKLLVVEVVHEPNNSPLLLVFTSLARYAAHDTLDTERVFDQAVTTVELLEKRERLIAIEYAVWHLTSSFLPAHSPKLI